MAWTSMHFAVGMGCAGVAYGAASLVLRRGLRWLPFAMTLGGLWAVVPDAPRLWREDFPWLPFASTLGARSLEVDLHAIGDLFFFHHALDAQPHEYALHGLILMLLFYNTAFAISMWSQRRHRQVVGRVGQLPDSEAAPSLKLAGHSVRSSHLQRTA